MNSYEQTYPFVYTAFLILFGLKLNSNITIPIQIHTIPVPTKPLPSISILAFF